VGPACHRSHPHLNRIRAELALNPPEFAATDAAILALHQDSVAAVPWTRSSRTPPIKPGRRPCSSPENLRGASSSGCELGERGVSRGTTPPHPRLRLPLVCTVWVATTGYGSSRGTGGRVGVDFLNTDRPAVTQFLIGVPEYIPSPVVPCANYASTFGEITPPCFVLCFSSIATVRGSCRALVAYQSLDESRICSPQPSSPWLGRVPARGAMWVPLSCSTWAPHRLGNRALRLVSFFRGFALRRWLRRRKESGWRCPVGEGRRTTVNRRSACVRSRLDVRVPVRREQSSPSVSNRAHRIHRGQY
jgi:hypothetical protein